MNKNLAAKYLKAMGNEAASLVSNGTIYDNCLYIDTGNYLYNAQLSGSIYGGIPTNKIVALAGDEGTGKTFALLGIIKNFLKKNPDNFVAFFESEGAVNQKVLKMRGIDTSRVLLIPVESVEDFRNQSINFINSYEKEDGNCFMCLDSLGMLPSAKEVKDAEEGSSATDMTRAKIIKSIFRILTIKLSMKNIPLILTNHTYSEIGPYAKKNMGGGSGLKYAASIISFLSKAQYKEDEKLAGIKVTSTMEKSRETRMKTKVSVVIHNEFGLLPYSGLFDYCEENELLTKAGQQYFWTKDGETSKKYRKNIEEKPEEFFTKERLAQIDEHCKNYFLFSSNDVALTDEDDNIPDEILDQQSVPEDAINHPADLEKPKRGRKAKKDDDSLSTPEENV